jgi:hypothetical protein
MNNDSPNSPSEGEARSSKPFSEPTFDVQFLTAVKRLIPIEELKAQFRVTPKGLFMAREARDRFVVAYQSWLAEQGLPPQARTTEKVIRRVFQSEDPSLLYLTEGKNTLTGFLALTVVQQPQQYQIPFFLGSLTDSKSVLLPHDPIFSELPGLTGSVSPTGTTVSIQIGAERFVVSPASLKDFVTIAQHSARTAKEFPALVEAPAESLRALVTLLRRSKTLDAKTFSVVPAQFVTQSSLRIRVLGPFRFIFSSSGDLLSTIELRGKNLSHFVAREMALLRSKGSRSLGVFSFAHERDRCLGSFQLRGKKLMLLIHALAGFVEHIEDSPERRDNFSKHFSVRDCFEKFSTYVQTAQPIDAGLIKVFSAEFRERGTRFMINGPWIFVISADGVLTHCRARHARPSGREYRHRGNRSQKKSA